MCKKAAGHWPFSDRFKFNGHSNESLIGHRLHCVNQGDANLNSHCLERPTKK